MDGDSILRILGTGDAGGSHHLLANTIILRDLNGVGSPYLVKRAISIRGLYRAAVVYSLHQQADQQEQLILWLWLVVSRSSRRRQRMGLV